MESIRLEYKKDDFRNPILARVSWLEQSEPSPQPIAIIFHGGGLLAGSSELIPKPQTEYLCSHGFVVVAPNYRLCPQVTAREALMDCEEAYGWVTNSLSRLLASEYGIRLDVGKVVTMGHSTGGTIAMHIGASKPNIKACTAFYPTLYASDPANSAHKSWALPPQIAAISDHEPTDEDWKLITPSDIQVSESSLATPGTTPTPRNRWQMSLLKNGNWLKTICPDGDFSIIDPLTRVHSSSTTWPAVLIIQGDQDDAPGSGLDLAYRAEQEMTSAGVVRVSLEVVEGAHHMFDLPLGNAPGVEPGWQAVIRDLDWLRSYCN